MAERVGDWLYLLHGRRAHWAPSGTMKIVSCRLAFVVAASQWYGTGSQREYERAAGLPKCSECLAKGAPHGDAARSGEAGRDER